MWAFSCLGLGVQFQWKHISDFMGLRVKAGKLGVKYINMKVGIIGNVKEGVKEKDSMI